MAKPIDQNKLNSLIAERDKLASNTSGSSYTGDIQTPSDVARDASLSKLDTTIAGMKSQKQSNKWYGDTSAEMQGPGQQEMGTFSRIANTLQTPLYGVVGAIKGALGMNNGKGVLQSAYENADFNNPAGQGRQTFGDLMREGGVSNKIAAPVGFMADIAMDPITWLTMGTSALVPRVGAGLVEGTMKGGLMKGIEAAGVGATSRLGQMALTAADYTKYLPGFKGGLKNELTGAVKGGIKIAGSETMADLSAKVVAQYNKYNELIGYDPLKAMKANAGKSVVGLKFGEIAKTAINDYVPGGKELTRVFEYSSQKHAAMADAFNAVPGIEEAARKAVAAGGSKDELIGFLMENKEKLVESGAFGKMFKPTAEPYLATVQKKLEGFINEADNIANGGAEAIVDVEQRASAMMDVTRETLEDVAGSLMDAQKTKDKLTGIAVYDKYSTKLSNWMKDTFKREGQIRSDIPSEVAAEFEKAKAAGLIPEKDLAMIEGWKKETAKADSLKNLKKARMLTDKDMAELAELTSGTTAADKLYQYQNAWAKGKMTTGQKVIRAYDFFGDLFKGAQVAMSPSAMMNAVIGNPAMMMAAGVDMSPKFLESMYHSFNLARGKGDPDIVWKLFFSNEDFLKSFAAKDTKFQMATGQSREGLLNNFVLNSALLQKNKAGLLGLVDDAEIRDAYYLWKDEIMDIAKKYETTKVTRAAGELGADVNKKIAGTIETGPLSDVMAKMEQKGKALNSLNTATGWIPNEISSNDGFLREVKDYVKKRAAEGSPINKLMDFGINGLSGVFEGIDQTYKLGLALHLANNGLSEKELKIASATYPKLLDAVMGTYTEAGQTFYKIGWNKSIDFSNEVFMNYAAMPPAVKLMRTLPILNAPFVSFAYAMLPKFGKALVHNPAFFNKMSFAQQEFSGQQGPMEREALKSKYNAMLNSPGMMKLPEFGFFKKYPMYLNIMNYNPFMSLSILGDSQRTYADDNLGKVAAMMDKLGIMGNPIGQVIKDFIVLPYVMSQDPSQNQYGQKLYPDDATFMEKAGYAAKDVVGAYIPKPLNMVAAPFVPTEIGGVNVVDKLPRNLAGLVGGINSMSNKGVIKKDDAPIGNALRAYMSAAGVQVQPLDLTFNRTGKTKK